jgi:hypothetical protein
MLASSTSEAWLLIELWPFLLLRVSSSFAMLLPIDVAFGSFEGS